MIADEPIAERTGRPPFEPTEHHREVVSNMTACGITQEQVALYLDIDVKTLTKYFRRELDVAAIEANAKVARSLFVKATTGDMTAAIWWTKTRMGWKERQDVNHTGGFSLNVVTGIDRSE